jgi:hypothetical protein
MRPPVSLVSDLMAAVERLVAAGAQAPESAKLGRKAPSHH